MYLIIITPPQQQSGVTTLQLSIHANPRTYSNHFAQVHSKEHSPTTQTEMPRDSPFEKHTRYGMGPGLNATRTEWKSENWNGCQDWIEPDAKEIKNDNEHHRVSEASASQRRAGAEVVGRPGREGRNDIKQGIEKRRRRYRGAHRTRCDGLVGQKGEKAAEMWLMFNCLEMFLILKCACLD